jgi:hypothetical protein
VLVEFVVEPKPTPQQTLFDMTMLVVADGGRERTIEEFSALFDAAGLVLVEVMLPPVLDAQMLTTMQATPNPTGMSTIVAKHKSA